MKKLASTFTNMFLSLTIIALVSAGLLAGVYLLTKEPIEQAEAQKQRAALQQVLPPCDSIANDTIEGNVRFKAYEQGQWVGTAVQCETTGFGGSIKVLTGFNQNKEIINYVVLSQTETPGLGTKMVDWFKEALTGKSMANGNLSVTKDGGDIQAITAATISSRAFLKAVNLAYHVANDYTIDELTAATELAEDAATEASTENEEAPTIQEKGENHE